MGLIILRFRITTREAEVKEDWKTQHVEQQNEIRTGPLSDWGIGAGDLVKTGQKIVKVSPLSQQTFSSLNEWQYGLYDRPDLKSWFKGRIVLLGDAAHPTSPVCSLIIFHGVDRYHRI
jgi:salicylate hydroxylase